MAKLKTGRAGLDNLSAGSKVAIGVIFMAMVGAAYYVVFYSDVSDSIEAQKQALEAKKKELAEAETARQAYNKDVAEKARKDALQKKQQKILPDKSESPAFLSTIQTVATIAGIKLESWTPLDETPEAFYAKVPMQLKLAGKFHQIAKFFYGIGQVDRIINMENIVIKVLEAKEKLTPEEIVSGIEETVTVEVECLATAFRAISADDRAKKNRKRGEKQ
jgi:type IV pilus assembly protein PilO